MALPIPFSNPATYVGHSGVDFGQPRGTRFRASGPGVVNHRNQNARGGNLMWVKYDAGILVGYAHLDDYTDSPVPGTRVSEGTVLGRVGNSGHSTGPHLHVEVNGYATTDGFWRFFDRDRVVGAVAPAATSTSTEASEMNADDKEWTRLMIRQELGPVLARILQAIGEDNLSEQDKAWSREMARQEIGGALNQKKP